MKRLFSLVMMLVMLLAVTLPEVQAQANGSLSNKDLKQIEKDAKKDAKDKEKDGWKVFSGGLPIVRQYEESYRLRRMKQDGENMYLVETGAAVGQNFSVAKMQAIENAKLLIANSLESDYVGEMLNNLGNQEFSTEDSASISDFKASSSNSIAKQLGRVTTVVEVYKELPNKQVRVEVTVAYSAAKAKEIAKRTAQKELKEKTSELSKQVQERRKSLESEKD